MPDRTCQSLSVRTNVDGGISLGPVEAQLVFSHRWPADTPRGTWPAFSARWTLGEEITL